MAPAVRALMLCTQTLRPQASRTRGRSCGRGKACRVPKTIRGHRPANHTLGTGSSMNTPQKVPQPTQQVMH